jgi:hypothetical protein
MKRYLNKVKTINVQKLAGKTHKYAISDTYSPEHNELVIGRLNNVVVGLFVCKVEGQNKNLYSLSFDDFSYDFLNSENIRLNNAFNILQQNLNSISPLQISEISEDIPGGN